MRHVAAAVALLSAAGARGQVPAEAQKKLEITVTNLVVSRECGGPFGRPVPEREFLTTDPMVCIQFQYRGGHKGDKLRFEWVNPLGTVMTTYSGEQNSDNGSYFWNWILGIAGAPPSFSPGDWQVRVLWNDLGVAALPFRIVTPPQSVLEWGGKTLLPSATTGVAYSYHFTARGGEGPYRWTSTGGLPSGLSLSAEGVLSGTAVQRGNHAFAVTVRDQAGNTLTRKVAMGVALPVQVRVAAFALTGARPAGGTCAQGPNSTEYKATQPAVWFDFQLSGDRTVDDITVEWLDPSGDVAARRAYKEKEAHECSHSEFGLARNPNFRPGDWRVRVLANGGEVLSLPFHAGAAEAARSGRVALLIGNTAYQRLAPIASAEGDIEVVGAALRRDGFEVTSGSNLSIDDWRRTERAFLAKVQKGDVVVVYFSGYGVHERSENWLLPVNFDPQERRPLSTRAYSVLRLRQLLEEKEAKLKIFFLNAARSAPGLESAAQRAGLAAPEVDAETVYCLAESPERAAAVNASEKTSAFARVLAEVLQRPNIGLPQLFGAELRRAGQAAGMEAGRPAVFLQNPADFRFVK